jgi:hypothetical protein
MLEARIVASWGSLYFAAEATPYDLETLRQHLREFQRERSADNVTLELTIDDGANTSLVAGWLVALKAAGFAVRLRRNQHSEYAA